MCQCQPVNTWSTSATWIRLTRDRAAAPTPKASSVGGAFHCCIRQGITSAGDAECLRSASQNVLENRPSETIADIVPYSGYFGVSEVRAEMQDGGQRPGISGSFCGVGVTPARRSRDRREGGGARSLLRTRLWEFPETRESTGNPGGKKQGSVRALRV